MSRCYKNIDELTSLRGIAAFLIVLTHIPLYSAINNFSLIRNGYLMVHLFFVLSGFVIYRNYHDSLNDNRDIMRFLFLRLGRLYPVHVIFLLIFFIIEVAKYLAQYSLGISSPNSKPFHQNDIAAFFLNIFLLQGFTPAHTYNGPAWSISAEFYTYILFALSALIFRNFKTIIFLLFCIASLF